jgi:hypothetical protein
MRERFVPLGGLAVGAVVLNLMGGAAMAATPKPRDVASARTLVSTVTRFDQTALNHEREMTAAAKAVVAQVQAACPGSIPSSVANGTPAQQAVALDLILEGSFDLSIAVIHPLDHAALALAKGLDRAHFSQRAFSRGVHATAKVQRRFVALAPSDFCGDVKAAAAGGFAADAPGTTAFLKSFENIGSSAALAVPAIIRKVKPYLLAAHDRAALKHLTIVDARYQKFSMNLGLKWGARLGSVLVGSPPPGGGTGGFPTGPPTPSSLRTALT